MIISRKQLTGGGFSGDTLERGQGSSESPEDVHALCTINSGERAIIRRLKYLRTRFARKEKESNSLSAEFIFSRARIFLNLEKGKGRKRNSLEVELQDSRCSKFSLLIAHSFSASDIAN